MIILACRSAKKQTVSGVYTGLRKDNKIICIFFQVLNERLDKEKENYASLQEASKKKLLDSNQKTKELINTLKQRMAVSGPNNTRQED